MKPYNRIVLFIIIYLMIFLALKTYRQATGDEAINILAAVKKVTRETSVPIITVAQPTDIYRIKNELGIEVWAQHVDPIEPGKNTGWICPYAVKAAGATGVLVNHSEHKLDREKIAETLSCARKYGLKTMLIGQTPELVLEFDGYDTDLVSYEKEDLIAGPVSMIDQQEDVIRSLVTKLKRPLVIGAGINDGEDARKSKITGAAGILLATYFVTARDPEAKLRELAEGFRNAVT